MDYVKGENLTVTGLLIEAFGLLQRQREPLRMPASDSPTADFGASLRARPDGQTPRAGRPPEGRMSPPLAKDYMRMTDDVPSWRARKSL